MAFFNASTTTWRGGPRRPPRSSCLKKTHLYYMYIAWEPGKKKNTILRGYVNLNSPIFRGLKKPLNFLGFFGGSKSFWVSIMETYRTHYPSPTKSSPAIAQDTAEPTKTSILIQNKGIETHHRDGWRFFLIHGSNHKKCGLF